MPAEQLGALESEFAIMIKLPVDVPALQQAWGDETVTVKQWKSRVYRELTAALVGDPSKAPEQGAGGDDDDADPMDEEAEGALGDIPEGDGAQMPTTRRNWDPQTKKTLDTGEPHSAAEIEEWYEGKLKLWHLMGRIETSAIKWIASNRGSWWAVSFHLDLWAVELLSWVRSDERNTLRTFESDWIIKSRRPARDDAPRNDDGEAEGEDDDDDKKKKKKKKGGEKKGGEGQKGGKGQKGEKGGGKGGGKKGKNRKVLVRF